jgi:predicted nucleic acid-binding protein
MILLDTNLLGRLTDSADPLSEAARQAVHTLLAKGERLIIVPQNLYEFWAVATRRPGTLWSGRVKSGASSRTTPALSGPCRVTGSPDC